MRKLIILILSVYFLFACEHIDNIKYTVDYNRQSKYYDEYKKDCELNVGKGCYYLGNLYKSGRVPYNYMQTIETKDRINMQTAMEYYEKSCNLNYGEACSTIGNLYQFHSETEDYRQAKTYYEKACDLNNVDGCKGLSILYEHGQGVRQDIQTAKEYLSKACHLSKDEMVCYSYARLNEKVY